LNNKNKTKKEMLSYLPHLSHSKDIQAKKSHPSSKNLNTFNCTFLYLINDEIF